MQIWCIVDGISGGSFGVAKCTVCEADSFRVDSNELEDSASSAALVVVIASPIPTSLSFQEDGEAKILEVSVTAQPESVEGRTFSESVYSWKLLKTAENVSGSGAVELGLTVSPCLDTVVKTWKFQEGNTGVGVRSVRDGIPDDSLQFVIEEGTTLSVAAGSDVSSGKRMVPVNGNVVNAGT